MCVSEDSAFVSRYPVQQGGIWPNILDPGLRPFLSPGRWSYVEYKVHTCTRIMFTLANLLRVRMYSSEKIFISLSSRLGIRLAPRSHISHIIPNSVPLQVLIYLHFPPQILDNSIAAFVSPSKQTIHSLQDTRKSSPQLDPCFIHFYILAGALCSY